MKPETRKWITDAVEMAKDASSRAVLILLRNDDDEIVVTNATDAATVRELGMALATGYGLEPDEPREVQ